jgi:pimeloyl-ACP methyl ester carboxylesterase
MRPRTLIAGGILLAGAAVGLRMLLRNREDMTLEDAPYPGKLIEIDGARLHYIEAGDGPPVILIHGFGGHTISFRHTIPALSSSYRVIAVDLLGFGYSERPEDASYTLKAQAGRVLALMDALGLERAALAGHSMGGGVAMHAAATAPERIVKLALVASVSGDRFRARVAPSWLLRPFLPAITRFAARRIFRASFYDPANATPEVFTEYARPARIRGSRDGLLRILEDAGQDQPIDYDRITQPTLILWAAGERVLPRWALDRLRKHLAHARVVTIERAGHLLLEEQPEACNAALVAFLDEPLPGQSTVDATATRA